MQDMLFCQYRYLLFHCFFYVLLRIVLNVLYVTFIVHYDIKFTEVGDRSWKQKCILQFINDKPVISQNIDLTEEKNIILHLHEDGLVSPIIPYKFRNIEEIADFYQTCKKRNYRLMLLESKLLWKMFAIADQEGKYIF